MCLNVFVHVSGHTTKIHLCALCWINNFIIKIIKLLVFGALLVVICLG